MLYLQWSSVFNLILAEGIAYLILIMRKVYIAILENQSECLVTSKLVVANVLVGFLLAKVS